jgi:protein-L-isoaspartate(D-aspartate) O-methyltransferase
MESKNRTMERNRMVDEHVIPAGVENPAVLEAMRRVPRHAFVPEGYVPMAYLNEPLPIGHNQTISQPSLVAFMIQALQLRGIEKVLEVGTGSGYQTAVLAELLPHVFSIEIVEPLATRAKATLAAMGYRNVSVRVGDGYQGWEEEAPFDAIILTAAPDHIPQPLLDQMAIGGRLILPLGSFVQELVLITRSKEGYQQTMLLPVRFVPMTGKAEELNHGRSAP